MNFTKALKSASTATAAAIAAVAILGLFPKDKRNQEVERARRNVAERRAQIEQQKAEIEAELKQLKKELKAVKEAEVTLTELYEPEPLPELAELPTIPNLWDLEPEFTPAATEAQLPPAPQPQLCLPLPQPEPTPQPAPAAKKVKSKAVPKQPKPAPIPTMSQSIPAVISDYSKLSIRELKKLASGKVKNYGKMTKAQLIATLNASN